MKKFLESPHTATAQAGARLAIEIGLGDESLELICSRYEINGYDRELHGALLDSKILGDVYLSMTGGQSDLDFSDNSGEDKNINLSKDQASARKKLKAIKVSVKEKARNLKYLADMKEETNVEPIWNQEHE